MTELDQNHRGATCGTCGLSEWGWWRLWRNHFRATPCVRCPKPVVELAAGWRLVTHLMPHFAHACTGRP